MGRRHYALHPHQCKHYHGIKPLINRGFTAILTSQQATPVVLALLALLEMVFAPLLHTRGDDPSGL